MTIDDYKKGLHYGMHGLGFADGISQKNTLDVFEYWYGQGIRFFETDIAFTSDGEMVLLAHDFSDRYLRRLEIYDKPSDRIWTKEYVQTLTIGNKNKGCKFLFWDEFVEIIRLYNDTVFMIDSYGRSEKEVLFIADKVDQLCDDTYKDYDRILFETYTKQDSVKVKEEHPNIKQIVYIGEDGYHFFDGQNKYDKCKELELLPLDFISCPYRFCKENSALIHFCEKKGIGVLTFSRYDTERTKKRELGVNVNLVDVYTGEDGDRNYFRIIKSMSDYVFHRGRILKIERGQHKEVCGDVLSITTEEMYKG